ncbi:prepilin peptidase, partial [Dietzia sp. DQ12-76]|nr:prepilin peptidase [Dietzia sp. DQ12-76]
MLPSTTATVTAILTAAVCAALAAALTGWIRSVADSDSRWLRSGLHVALAAAGGA